MENKRCTEEIWNIRGITLEEALKKANSDPRVKALHWYKKKGGDGRVGGIEGWYQGAGGNIGTVENNDWDTILIKKDNYCNNVLENVRCTEEIWNIKGITLEEALKKANSDPRVKALHWYKKKGGNSLFGGIKGWYQGAGGHIGTVENDDWDTIVLKKDNETYKLLKNVRCSKEIWDFKGTFEQALQKCKSDSRVKAMHWFNKKGGYGLIDGIKGRYQGAGGDIGKVNNSDWDTIVLNNENEINRNVINRLNKKIFYSKTNIIYPPFKNGLYLEEYFLKYLEKNQIITKRNYIPAFWTNFQDTRNFKNNKINFQKELDRWVNNNPNTNGYFCMIQHDDGPPLDLPKNTIVYNGGNNGNFPIPLIYEDLNNTLINIPKKSFKEKDILCSFVGRITHNKNGENVRKIIFETFKDNKLFKIMKPNEDNHEKGFIDITVSSKFALAPRGYGRTSFRFFECFLLGTIPIYVWNDKNWLPFQNVIDYNKLCIVIHISEINTLESKLKSISEKDYNLMWDYYKQIKHLFELEGMTKQIISEIGIKSIRHKFSLCIPTMDRYDNFLSVNLPKYIDNPFIDEIVISDENGNDVEKIKKNIKNLDKFNFNINSERKGVFYNKLHCCKLAKNEWIALIDSDNFADINYFNVADKFLNNIYKSKKNIILAPLQKSIYSDLPAPKEIYFDFSKYTGMCLKRGNFQNIPDFKRSRIIMNTMNYVLNKNLVDNLFLSNEDKKLLSKKGLSCDSILLNTLFFEQFNMEMYIVPNMYYEHIVHKGSNWIQENGNSKKETNIVNERYYKLLETK